MSLFPLIEDETTDVAIEMRTPLLYTVVAKKEFELT